MVKIILTLIWGLEHQSDPPARQRLIICVRARRLVMGVARRCVLYLRPKIFSQENPFCLETRAREATQHDVFDAALTEEPSEEYRLNKLRNSPRATATVV